MTSAETVCPRRAWVHARWRRLLAAAVIVAAQAGRAAQAQGRIIEPAGGRTVRAGDVVSVRWTPVAPTVREFELLLSIDGGRTFPLRLTAMLDPRLTSYSWRVPNLPSGAARLRLRVGEGEEEVVLPPGPAFAIAAATGEPTSRITFRDGEWWPTEGVASEPQAVEAAPRWMEGGDGGPCAVAAAAVPPQHPDLGAAQAMMPAGRAEIVRRPRRPECPARGGLGAASFPKRE